MRKIIWETSDKFPLLTTLPSPLFMTNYKLGAGAWGGVAGLSALPVGLYIDRQVHLLANSNPLPGGRNAVCCCNCMLARACWYWKIPVLKTAVAPLVFSRAGLFGNGGSTAWGIPCLVNEYKKQIPVKREKEKEKSVEG